MTDDSLWTQQLPVLTLNAKDANWSLLSAAGSIQSISAVTDKAGNQWCYAIVTAGDNLWLNGPTPSIADWQPISSGSFQQVSAGLNSAGQPVSDSVLTSGQLWEENPALGSILANDFVQLSGIGGLPSTFLSVQAGGPDTMFGIASDETVWEHSPNGNKQLSSILLASQLSATQTPTGGDEVFMTLIDSTLFEYSLGRQHLRRAARLRRPGDLDAGVRFSSGEPGKPSSSLALRAGVGTPTRSASEPARASLPVRRVPNARPAVKLQAAGETKDFAKAPRLACAPGPWRRGCGG